MHIERRRTDYEPDLGVAACPSLSNRPVGVLYSFLNIQTVKVDFARPAVRVILCAAT